MKFSIFIWLLSLVWFFGYKLWKLIFDVLKLKLIIYVVWLLLGLVDIGCKFVILVFVWVSDIVDFIWLVIVFIDVICVLLLKFKNCGVVIIVRILRIIIIIISLINVKFCWIVCCCIFVIYLENLKIVYLLLDSIYFIMNKYFVNGWIIINKFKNYMFLKVIWYSFLVIFLIIFIEVKCLYRYELIIFIIRK